MLHVIPASGRGGAQQVCATLVEGVDRARFESWVVCHGQGAMLPVFRRHARGALAMPLLNVTDVRSLVGLARLMRRLRIDIVHTHLWQADVLGVWAAMLARVPLRISTVHGRYFVGVGSRSRAAAGGALRSSHRVLSRLFSKTLAVSRYVADDLTRRPVLAVPRAQVAQVYNGVKLATVATDARAGIRRELGVSEGAQVATVVANFLAVKGHRWAIEALPRVRARLPAARLVLVGEGPLLPAIRAQVRAAGLEGVVRFPAAVPTRWPSWWRATSSCCPR